MLSSSPFVKQIERLEVIYNPRDNFDHVITSDYDYKRWNTFAQGKAPNSIAFGIKGNFHKNPRAVMNVFSIIWIVSENAKNFSSVDVLLKDKDKGSIGFNIRVIGAILDYHRNGKWTRDISGEFNINYT